MYEDIAQHIQRYLRTLTDFSRAAQVIFSFQVPPHCQTLDVYRLHNILGSSLAPATDMRQFMDGHLEQLKCTHGLAGLGVPRPLTNAKMFLSRSLLNDSGKMDASWAFQENGSVHPEAALMALAHSVYLGEDGVLQHIARREGLLPVSRNSLYEACVRAELDVKVFGTDAHRNQPRELRVLCRLCTPPLESWAAHPEDARG